MGGAGELANPSQAKLLVLFVDFFIVVAIFHFFCEPHLLTILFMTQESRLILAYLSDAGLLEIRITRYVAMLAPFAICSYLT